MHSVIHEHRHSSASHSHVLGSPRMYDFTVELFFLGRRRSSYQALVVAAGIRPGHRVLDVGCGTGYFARAIAAAVGPAGLVVGIDPSPSMIEHASHKEQSGSNCQFQVGAAEALPLPADHFDVVVSSLVLHHLPEALRQRAMEEMRRVVRPGGRLLIAEARSPQRGVLSLIARAHGYDRMAQQVKQLDSLASAAGFVDTTSGEVPPWLRYVTATRN